MNQRTRDLMRPCGPPLTRMGSYTVEPTGQLRRHAVSYEEELYASTEWPTTPAARS